MSPLGPVVQWFLRSRYSQIEQWVNNPFDSQQEIFTQLILQGKDTERGAYEVSTGQRQPGATFFLPTAGEWHKAACYDPEKKAYRLLPLRNAHELHGEIPPSKSHYGMLETADPIWEWTESKFGEQFRCLRSDSWFQGNNHQAKGHFYTNPTSNWATWASGSRGRPRENRLASVIERSPLHRLNYYLTILQHGLIKRFPKSFNGRD